jgi:predicted metal-dependent enzyme (double-stranded beta helix superfamily)
MLQLTAFGPKEAMNIGGLPLSKKISTKTGVSSGPIARLAQEIEEFADEGLNDRKFIQAAEPAIRRLLAEKNFLPEEATLTSDKSYARHLLHTDRENRFCIAAMVWTPGQGTPIHDHDGSWGMIGMVRGKLEVVNFYAEEAQITSGEVDLTSEAPNVPSAGSEACVCGCADIHAVNNRFDETAISIHIYARELQKCHIYEPIAGAKDRFMASEKNLVFTRDSSS